MLAAFDLELRERVRERGGDLCGFFVVELFGQTSFGTAARFLGFRFVDVLGLDRHVGHDGNAIAGDFGEAFTHSQEVILVVLAGVELAWLSLAMFLD